ncbi:biliverdin-producing heme oxygenase, partial [Georgenia sp. 10Sc9-8]|nr:biliverdin-producing heme oxygenase [Georgenia halotolerans]
MSAAHDRPAGSTGHASCAAVGTSVPRLSTAEDPAGHLPLSTALREGTCEEHRAAESTGFVTDLLAGRLSVAAYADMAAQHYLVYRELERAGDVVATTGWATPIMLPALRRLPALEVDLTHLLGPCWHDRLRPTAAVRRYVSRLAQVGRTRTGYPAHAYVRYLGDLSGGQVVGRMLARHYAVDARALNFYHFPE